MLGAQWGDEGKGKLVDALAQHYDVVARAQGGANAGHTIYDDTGAKWKLHLLPSGVLNPSAKCVVGNGVVVHVPSILEEIEGVEARGVDLKGRLFISDRAHALVEAHKAMDGAREEELAGEGKAIGTTRRGIGPAYATKAQRIGLRIADLFDPVALRAGLERLHRECSARFPSAELPSVDAEVERYASIAERIRPYVVDTVSLLHGMLSDGTTVLIEGANATMLDLDFGTYPYVTSSNPSAGGALVGLGIPPRKLGKLIAVVKAYTTRVGEGPYPTELHGALADALREKGAEYGTTTGRPRRVGWLDLPALRYADRVNAFDEVNLTKLDVLDDLETIEVCTGYRTPQGDVVDAVPASLEAYAAYEPVFETLPGWKTDISAVRVWDDLPENAKNYCSFVEKKLGVHVRWIGVGPGRDAIVLKPKEI